MTSAGSRSDMDMETLEYVLAAPETRVMATLLGWVCGMVCAGVIARVVQR